MNFLARCSYPATAVLLSAAACWSQLQATPIRSFRVDANGSHRYLYAVAKDEIRGTYLVGHLKRINNVDVPLLAEFDTAGRYLGDIALPCLPRRSTLTPWIEGIRHDVATDTYLLLYGENSTQDVYRVDRSGLCTHLNSLCFPARSIFPAPAGGAYWIGMINGTWIEELRLGAARCTTPVVFTLPSQVSFYGSVAYVPTRGTLLLGNGPVHEVDLQGRSLGVLSLPSQLGPTSVQDIYYSSTSSSLIALDGSGVLTELSLWACPGQIEISLEPSCFRGGLTILSATGCATLGGTVRLDWAGTLATPAFFFGVSNSRWAGISLPRPLGSFGTSVCYLRTGGDAIQPLTSPIGPHVATIRIPQVPSLIGFDTFIQVIGLYPFSTDVASSNLVRIRIG